MIGLVYDVRSIIFLQFILVQKVFIYREECWKFPNNFFLKKKKSFLSIFVFYTSLNFYKVLEKKIIWASAFRANQRGLGQCVHAFKSLSLFIVLVKQCHTLTINFFQDIQEWAYTCATYMSFLVFVHYPEFIGEGRLINLNR